MNDTVMTIENVRTILIEAIATEAGLAADQIATDQPFTSYGLDSMAALSVGMEIEDTCGLRDLPTDLLWDHPTVDSLTDALWSLMRAESLTAAGEKQ